MTLRNILIFAAGLVFLASSAGASSLYTVTFAPDGAGNVVATGSGSIDLSNLFFVITTGVDAYVYPSDPAVFTGPATIETEDVYTGLSAPTGFGPGLQTDADAGSGDMVGISGPSLCVPEGYTSGDPLSDTSIYDNTDLATLGLTPGMYTYMNSSAAFVVDVSADAPTPEPASFALIATSAAVLLLKRRALRR
jgi:membrane protein implicated in regulation of membrane protease activity